MHGCWSPVPRCRPSFQQLVLQLEVLVAALSPAPPLREPLHYVNLKDEEKKAEAGSRAPHSEEEVMLATAAAPSWMVPWQQETEGGAADWLMVGSDAALAIGGDYRYIFGPCALPGEEEEEEARGRALMMREESGNTLQEIKDEDDDVIINV